MDLKIAKSKIKIVTSDEGFNKRVHGIVQKPTDCFGIDFDEDHDECTKCVINSEIDDRREPLRIFCKEIVQERIEKMEKVRNARMIVEPLEPSGPVSPEAVATPIPELPEPEESHQDVMGVVESVSAEVTETEPAETEPAGPQVKLQKSKSDVDSNLKLKIRPDIEKFVKEQISSGKKNREFSATVTEMLRNDISASGKSQAWLTKQVARICWVVSKRYNLRSKK